MRTKKFQVKVECSVKTFNWCNISYRYRIHHNQLSISIFHYFLSFLSHFYICLSLTHPLSNASLSMVSKQSVSLFLSYWLSRISQFLSLSLSVPAVIYLTSSWPTCPKLSLYLLLSFWLSYLSISFSISLSVPAVISLASSWPKCPCPRVPSSPGSKCHTIPKHFFPFTFKIIK